MTKLGSNEFTSFSVPLVFAGRYFILEPGDPPPVATSNSPICGRVKLPHLSE